MHMLAVADALDRILGGIILINGAIAGGEVYCDIALRVPSNLAIITV